MTDRTDLSVSFRQTHPIGGGEACRDEETVFGGADRGGTTASRVLDAGGGEKQKKASMCYRAAIRMTGARSAESKRSLP